MGARRSDISAATRIEILKSAAAAFRKLGYHGATVEQIAAALRMKKGNLYYYFKNKEEILFACHEYSHDRLQELLDDAVRSTAPAEAKLRRLITGAVHVILDELHGTALLLDLEALSPAHLKAVVHRRDRFDRGMRLIIEEGMATGVFAPGDPKLLGFAMLGALNWISRWFNPNGPSSSEDIATRFADYLIAGLRAV
jgi:TetR/AcrR family transcriptional regulator, cholesterol catabolism regulator